MNGEALCQQSSNGETKLTKTGSNRAMLWGGVGFAVLQLSALEVIGTIRLLRIIKNGSPSDVLHLIVAGMATPLLIMLMVLLAYRKIKVAVVETNSDRRVIEIVAGYGSMILGFCFLAMTLIT